MKLRYLVILLEFLLHVANAFGQGRWQDARVVFLTDGGSASFVDISGETYLISCAHRDARTSVTKGSRVGYLCNNGNRGMATVIAVAPNNPNSQPFTDCAIYETTGQIGSKENRFTISQRRLNRGEKVWVCGFPRGQYFSSRTTTVIDDGDTLWLNGRSTPGESGGPIVNTDGQLVGTLTGFSGNETICCGRQVATHLCAQVSGALAQYCPPCQSCPQGFCEPPIYYQRPPQRPPTTRPPTKPPTNGNNGGEAPPFKPPANGSTNTAGTPGPAGPPGPQGPPGKPGESPNVDAIAAAVAAKVEQNLSVTIQQKIEQYLSQHPVEPPKVPTIDEIAAELAKRRKPPRIRVVDGQGKYTTPFITLHDNTDNDLIIEQRFTSEAQP